MKTPYSDNITISTREIPDLSSASELAYWEIPNTNDDVIHQETRSHMIQ